MSDNKENLVEIFNNLSIKNRRITRSASKFLNKKQFDINDKKIDTKFEKSENQVEENTIKCTKENIKSEIKEEFSKPLNTPKICRRATKISRRATKININKSDVTENKVVSCDKEKEAISNFIKNNEDKKDNIDKEIDLNSYNKVIGRDNEKEAISDFIKSKVDNKESGNLYISGVPGTGKTAIVNELMQDLTKYKFYYINCMNYSSGLKVIDRVGELFDVSTDKIENYLRTRQNKAAIILVLDEIDQLEGKHQSTLYRVFEWAEISLNYSFILIGIANTLNLIDVQLSRLKLNKTAPAHIRIAPYTSEQLSQIIEDRVKDNVDLTPEQRLALTMSCRKMEKSGDARAAIDLYRQAAEFASKEMTPLKSSPCKNNQYNSPQTCQRKLSFASPSIKHVQRAFSLAQSSSDPFNAIRSRSNSTVSLPLHQKLILCSALILLDCKSKNSQPIVCRRNSTINGVQSSAATMTFGRVYDKYCVLCNHLYVSCLSSGEILNLCDLLDSRSLARLGKHKDTRSRPFNLSLDREGIYEALSDDNQIMEVLNSPQILDVL